MAVFALLPLEENIFCDKKWTRGDVRGGSERERERGGKWKWKWK